MRSKNQKIGRRQKGPGTAHRGPGGRGSFHEYRVTGVDLEPIRIFAQSAKQAEDGARRLMGGARGWKGDLVIKREKERWR